MATVLSFTLPPVKNSLTGLPMPSTRAWIFVFFPPREIPMSWFVSAPKAPFLRRRRADAPWRLCCPLINPAYQHLYSKYRRFSLSRPRQTIWRTYHIRYSTNHIVPANLAMRLRFAPSKECRLKHSGYLLTVCLAFLSAPAAGNPLLVPIRSRLLRIFSILWLFISPLPQFTSFTAFWLLSNTP